MSKSKGNYIGVTDEPNDMFGKVMSIPDSLMENYFTLLTDLPEDRIKTLCDASTTHPRDAKARLATAIVAQYHSAEAADAAATEFDRVFAQKQTPDEMDEITTAVPVNVVELICQAAFAKSKSEARRLVQQNAVSLDDEKITDIDAEVTPADGTVLRVGKRRFARLRVQ
jgi:tyrosyl-tRNA synthetase